MRARQRHEDPVGGHLDEIESGVIARAGIKKRGIGTALHERLRQRRTRQRLETQFDVRISRAESVERPRDDVVAHYGIVDGKLERPDLSVGHAFCSKIGGIEHIEEPHHFMQVGAAGRSQVHPSLLTLEQRHSELDFQVVDPAR